MARVLRLTEIFDDIVERVSSSKLVNLTLGNPFITALTIIFIMILILMIVFRNEAFTYDEKSKYFVKIGFIMFVIVSGILFFQNYLVMKETNVKIGSHDFGNVFDIRADNIEDDEDIPFDFNII